MSKTTHVKTEALARPDFKAVWFGTLMMIMVAMTLLIAGCGSGDADEPSGPSQPVVQIPGSGGSSGSGTPAGGSSTPATTGSSTTSSTPVAQLDACNIDALNNGRFLGTGLTVVAIVDETQCPICASGESCTTSSGQCRCLVVTSS